MEWIANYGQLVAVAVLIIVGWLGIRWAKSVANDKDDPELAKNAKGFAAMGWGALLVGVVLLIVATIKLL